MYELYEQLQLKLIGSMRHLLLNMSNNSVTRVTVREGLTKVRISERPQRRKGPLRTLVRLKCSSGGLVSHCLYSATDSLQSFPIKTEASVDGERQTC